MTAAANSGLASRSGDTSTRSTSSAAIRSASSATVVSVDELTVMQRKPSRLAARIWLRIEREQRRHEQRRPQPLLTQDAGGHEVDGALAPSGPLYDEHPLAPEAQRFDRLALPVAEHRGRIARERPQRIEHRVGGGEFGHGSSMTAGYDSHSAAGSRSATA